MGQSRTKQHIWWDAALCMAAVVVALMASRSSAELGLIDDFSYVRTAWAFARTGHFQYFGWSAVPLGVQTVWAAPFIRALGPTYFACRLSSQVMLVLSVWLMHTILRRCALNRGYAAFGALALGLSPLVLGVGATFMSDVCSLFLLLVCMVCALRVVRASSATAAIAWLAFGACVGAAGGTERQTMWLCGLVLLPSAAWAQRRHRAVVATAALAVLGTVGAALACARWFARQPRSQNPPVIAGPMSRHAVVHMAAFSFASVFCLCMLLLPVLVMSVTQWKRLQWRDWVVFFVGGSATALGMHCFTLRTFGGGWAPWLDSVLPFLTNWALAGNGPIFGGLEQISFSVALGFLIVLACVVAWLTGTEAAPVSADVDDGLSWAEMRLVLLPFFAAYACLLGVRALWTPVFDRYLLPLFVISLVFLLRACQERLSPRVARVAWGSLALYACWGVIGTHDWVAMYRARSAAVAELQAAGIPRDSIFGGFEMDGAAEIDEHGGMTNIDTPIGVEPKWAPGEFVPGCSFYIPNTADIHPRYSIVWDIAVCQQPTAFPDVTYRAWLPPFQRAEKIMRVAP